MVSSLFSVDEKNYEANVIKESDQYIPASASKDTHCAPTSALAFRRNPRPPKETIYGAHDLASIQKLAFESQEEKLKTRMELSQDKLALHKKSKERVMRWDNTIHGARRRRLQAFHESRAEIERQRQIQDEEWAAFRKKEREAILNRARTLQRNQNPMYKTLHSQLLLSHVLYERDRQIEYKTKRRLLEKIADKTYELNQRLKTLSEIEHEKLETERKHRARIQEVQETRRQLENQHRQRHEENQKLRKQNEEELSLETHTANQTALAHRRQKQLDAEQRRSILSKQISEKQASKSNQEEEESSLEERNQDFREMKEWIEAKKKELLQKDIKERQERTAIISSDVLELHKAREKRVDDFIAITVRAKEGEAEKRTAAEKAKQDQQLAEQKKFLELRKAILTQRQEIKLEEKRADASFVRKEVERYQKETVDSEIKRRSKLRLVKEFNDKLVAERACEKDAMKQAKLKQEALEKAQQAVETDTFDNYAKSCIQEWNKTGRNVKPIQDWLLKQKKPDVHEKSDTKSQYRKGMVVGGNTFERLGFSVPWMPSLPSPPHV